MYDIGFGGGGDSISGRVKSFCAESSWCLNESTEGAVTRDGEPGPIFHDLHREGWAPARALKNSYKAISQAWLHWWYKEEAEVKIQASIENFVSTYKISAKIAPIYGMQTQMPYLRLHSPGADWAGIIEVPSPGVGAFIGFAAQTKPVWSVGIIVN